MAVAVLGAFSTLSNAAVTQFINYEAKGFIRLNADEENGGYIIKNTIEGTEGHTYVDESGELVADIDINFNPMDKVKSGDYVVLHAEYGSTPDTNIPHYKLHFNVDAEFGAQNEYSYNATVLANYGRKLTLDVAQGKTLTIGYRPNDYGTRGVGAEDEGVLTFTGGAVKIEAVGDHKCMYDEYVLDVNSNAIVAGGGSKWDAGGLRVQNESFVIESQIETPSDYIQAAHFNGGYAEIETGEFRISNSETGERFSYGLITSGGNAATIAAETFVIDADVAISSQDADTTLEVFGGDLTLLGRIEAYDGTHISFKRDDRFESTKVIVATEQANAVVGMPTDGPHNLSHSPVISFETDTLISAEGLSTEGDSDYRIYRPGEFDYAAVRANWLSVVNLNTEGSRYEVYGNLVAGRGQDDYDQQGGVIRFGGTGSVLVGDVLAGNTGSVELTLRDGAVFEGRTDDYADSELENEVFRPGEFEIDVTEKGTVSMTMNNALWTARGNSFLTTLSFEGSDPTKNVVDMSKEERSALTIGKVAGSGTVKMRLDAASEDHSDGDMLYIRDASEGEIFVDVDWVNGEQIEEGEWIRFATVDHKDASGIGTLRAVVRDQGFFNLEYATKTVDRAEDDSSLDAAYDGSSSEIEAREAFKPGEDVVNELFQDGGTNWYIGSAREEGGDVAVSDAGQTILGTARATYWNAVILDRWNQRYGERTYDENRSGVWARVKHERLGTDSGTGDFRSYNTMYQFGYDYAKPTENGKMIWGAAFDYMDGRTDYKSIEGDGGTDRTELSLYATYLGNNGFYGDLVLRGGKLKSDFDMLTPSGTALDADYDNWFYGVSFETGRQLENGTGWFVEPQVQMQYLRIASGDYSTAQTKVEQDAIDSLIGRAGFRVGKFLSDDKAQTVFFKADVLREFMGEQKIRVTDVTTRVGGEDVSISNHGTWFDVGAGFQGAVSKDFYAFGDVEYRFGNDLWNTWVFNVGAKYRF
ncbi:MAG: autotransporter outer membrane beta-barrel domain-containing protein [Sutterella sp.]|nr:autotransporter outer membrane beta-barrel domain-containing protein [Sutterella sp.]